MADKHSHLNGAYYGPAIPPQEDHRRTYHRHGRGGGGGCGACCCCECLFNCVCGCILQMLCTLVVVIGVIILVFWLVVRPHRVKFNVTDATLTQFDYTNGSLRYNLALNLTVRNPNKRVGIYYDSIEVNALYEDERFQTQSLTPFYQGHKNTTVLNQVFQGQHLLVLSGDGISQFNEDKADGSFDIKLKLNFRIRLKMGLIKVGKFKPKIDCKLKVPLTTNGTSVGQFEASDCSLDL